MNETAKRLSEIANQLDYMGIDTNCYVDPQNRVVGVPFPADFRRIAVGQNIVYLEEPCERTRDEWVEAAFTRDGITFRCAMYCRKSDIQQPQPPTLCGPAD